MVYSFQLQGWSKRKLIFPEDALLSKLSSSNKLKVPQLDSCVHLCPQSSSKPSISVIITEALELLMTSQLYGMLGPFVGFPVHHTL